ncbi:hypothetical protein DXG03_004701 [Asterophora parasitica]|uniref:SH3 domain-containing protein n=1 Tax=Asterophora parasitica TaxID=117018 RepID=A0A9P7G698_9AGAR|nr:hypothetical protein DXG03_004701 [Asterophora parasitica]
MTARRQPSTTSLSRYARASSPGLQNSSLDFCNAFWGIADGGVDVLLARMRGAMRTMEELRNFWKERAAIEDDYAKRLAKLAKSTLGRDEIGEMRNSLDTIRLETEQQAGYHSTLAGQIRTELEDKTGIIHQRQVDHKKRFQSIIEKEFKNKQAQEAHVNKAREKYEQDCVRINSYTAQASLVQGKDLEKINLKLERAQTTVQANERDFANFAKALQDTVQRWEMDWKTFCDACQDLEELRMDSTKDIMWAYANAVSTVCVSDDESCEKMRVALEQMETEKDMENFVHDYGTGNQIPDPPAFVNYNTPDAIPSSSSRPTFRQAHFMRSSQREIMRQNSVPQPEEFETPQTNAAGIGAGGSKRDSQHDPPLARQPSSRRGSNAPPQQVPQTNGYAGHSSPGRGHTPSPSGQGLARAATSVSRPSYRVPPQDPLAEPIDPRAETYIKVGTNAYRADPNKDPQVQGGTYNRSNASSPSKAITQGAVDPLAKHMQDLQMAVTSSGSVRRGKSLRRQSSPANAKPVQQTTRHHPSASESAGGSSSLSPPGTMFNIANGSSSQVGAPRDYHNTADLVVGGPPMIASRPSSPNPPTAAFMVPKPTPSPSGSEIIQEVLTDYQQSLPGERKSISRSTSPAGRPVNASQSQVAGMSSGHSHNLSQAQNLVRPPSAVGHPGIGAHGSRSNSPQPQQTISRGPSPAPQSVRSRNSQNYITPPSAPVLRAPSPNTVGIALDPNGHVLHDDMAHRYQQQHQPPPQQQQQQRQPQQAQSQFSQHQSQVQQPPPPPPQQQPPSQQQQQAHQFGQRRQSYIPSPAPAPIQHYGVTPPPPAMYQAPPPQQAAVSPARPTYAAPASAPVVQPQYAAPQSHYQAPPPQAMTLYQPQAQAQVQAQAPLGYQQQNGIQQQQGYYSTQQQQQQGLRTPAAYQQYGGGFRGPSPVAQRTPSPQPPPQMQGQGQGQMVAPPTGQTTEEGHGILFYVKALYDYAATIDEEFDFQAGDIIAVTATPEDGWWSGELLDEERRQRGRHVFPSNFVCLF